MKINRTIISIVLIAIMLLLCSCKIVGFIVPFPITIKDPSEVEEFRITNRTNEGHELIISFYGGSRCLEKVIWEKDASSADIIASKTLTQNECHELFDMINKCRISGNTLESYEELDVHNNSISLTPNDICSTSDKKENEIKRLYLDIDARFFN